MYKIHKCLSKALETCLVDYPPYSRGRQSSLQVSVPIYQKLLFLKKERLAMDVGFVADNCTVFTFDLIGSKKKKMNAFLSFCSVHNIRSLASWVLMMVVIQFNDSLHLSACKTHLVKCNEHISVLTCSQICWPIVDNRERRLVFPWKDVYWYG